jgi:hypothetical protein
MSPEVPNQEKLSNPEQARWLYDFLKSRLGDQPSGEGKFYRLDTERFALVYLWDIEPETYYGIAINSKKYQTASASELATYYVASEVIDKYIDVRDPQSPDEWDQEVVKPSEDEVANLIKGFEQDIEVPQPVFAAEMEAAEEEHQNKSHRKEIIMGAERPLIGFKDERREIHLASNIELMIPLERPTLQLDCQNCEEQLVVFYELSTPNKVECPGCGHENNLVKCINCSAEWQKGDQGFIELDIPYGSTVHDSLFDGPAYACSAKCLVEAFANDDFEARGMFADMVVEPVERKFGPVSELMDELFGLAREFFGEDASGIAELNRLVQAGTAKLPREGFISDALLSDAYVEPVEYVLKSFPREKDYTQGVEIFNAYMHIMKKLLPPEEQSEV